jgi:hypothetical protein
MTAHAEQLDRLQRWMLAAITDPAAADAAEIEKTILPSRQQSAAERLAVYGNAYFARLLEVLRELFPCTRFAVGDELFDRFAVAYLQQHPPYSYTLGRLADKLVAHLDATRPADWGEFVVELARLEQAIDRIFDAAGPEGLPPLVVPADSSDSIKLRFIPGFELHAFRYPVSRFYTDWKAVRQPAWPEMEPQYVALLRRDYVVRRHELSSMQYELLRALQGGASLGESLAAASAAGSQSMDARAADFRRWFAVWAAERFFSTIG